MSGTPPKKAYIIMPVGSDDAFEAKRQLIDASLRKRDWVPHFPVDFSTRNDLTDERGSSFRLSDTISGMQAADLIVADLSLERPSCYYELGVAQALGRPTFLIAEKGTPIHQTANREQVHFYTNIQGLAALLEVPW